MTRAKSLSISPYEGEMRSFLFKIMAMLFGKRKGGYYAPLQI
jgi:hypothetical protein